MSLYASAAKTIIVSLIVAVPLLAQEPWTDSSIETTAPKAGTIYHVGDTLKTQWTVHNNATPGGGLVVSISPNAGYNWVVIITETLKKGDSKYYQNDSQGTFIWVIPDSMQLWINNNVSTISDSCMIAVGAPYDEVFASSYTGIFSIKDSTGYVRASVDEETSGCGCGAGAGLALIPPIGFKIRRLTKKKKANKSGK